jgi:glycosyltransferase involved in cell wall biosynthesis
MRLGIKFTPTHTTVGGSQLTLAENLLPALHAQHPDLVLLTARPQVFGSLAEQVPVVPVRSPFLQKGLAAKAATFVQHQLTAAQAARRAGCDVVFCPYTYEIMPAARLPQVVFVHDLVPLHYPADYRVTAALWRAVYLPALRRVAAVVTNSAYTRSDFLAHSRVLPARVQVVGFGFTPSQGAAEWPASLPPGPYVLYVASSWYPYKNLAGLLRAFARLADHRPHRLVIVGQPVPRYAAALEQVLAEVALGDRVQLRSHVPAEELGRLYQHADLFAYPTMFEGFGIPPLEAMANQVPVVASRAAAIPETCGDAALYVPPGDDAALAAALEQALTDEPLRARLRAAGREQIQKFTWEGMATRILEVCRAAAEALAA